VRSTFLGLAVLTLSLGAPGAALAQAAAPAPSDQIVLSGDVSVPRGTVVGEVVVFSGSASIAGVAQGDVVVLDGPVTVTGQVGGDVVALGGSVHLADTAQVTGDVSASGAVTQADGAQVGGSVRRGVRFTLAGPASALGSLLASAAVAVSVLLVLLAGLLLAPRGLDRVAESAHAVPARSALWGLATWVLVPALAVVAAATVLGLPLALAVLLGAALVWLVGLAAVSFVIGRLFVRAPRSRLGAAFAGWGVIAAVGLVPVVNAVWWVLASMFGMGAVVVATWRSRHGAPLVPGGRGGRHRARGRVAPAPVPASAGAEASRPRDMPLAED
jgi:hypothetical protein